jgi:small subunit ribosomal protein S7
MRHKRVGKRQIIADPKYQNVQIAKFINYVMERGKKITAQRIVYKALDVLKDQLKQEPLEIFQLAIANATPSVETKSKRVGGANFQVPVPVDKDRGFALAVRWILAASRAKKGKPMHQKLAEEILNTYKGEGTVIKKKEDVHRMAESNRAFAHFAGPANRPNPSNQ